MRMDEMMAAGGWQHRRIPAFGDWNYPRDDDDDDDWCRSWQAPVTPCFDFAGGVPRKTRQRPSMPNARRMRIPAFGEWNHHHHHGDGDGGGGGNGINGTWPAAAVMTMTPFFDLAATPQRAPKTTGRRRRGDAELATAAEAAQQGHMLQTKRRSKVANYSGAYAGATARRSCFTVAKPVDDDLYGVPPDLLYGKGNPPPGARKDGWLKILRLLGCSCFSPPSQ